MNVPGGGPELISTNTEHSGTNSKPVASLSLDLDNQWSYMKTHGDHGWEKFPSYFDVLIPYVLDLLDELGLTITFFIVGQDAALDKNRDSLKALTERGHEVGNHSFHHEPWLHSHSSDRIEKEILETENQIKDVTGQKPLGFRGPGFSWSKDLITTLSAHGYLYDASTLPMYLGPLARMYYFWTSKLSEEEKSQRKNLYGNFKEGLMPVKPYLWDLPHGNNLLEIPVTTLPFVKIPFHLSYLLYISRYSKAVMKLYLRTAITLCKISGVSPSFLLHPLDFIGGDQVPDLAFFPGMDLDREHKLDVFKTVIASLDRHFRLSPMSVHARVLLQKKRLKRRHL